MAQVSRWSLEKGGLNTTREIGKMRKKKQTSGKVNLSVCVEADSPARWSRVLKLREYSARINLKR